MVYDVLSESEIELPTGTEAKIFNTFTLNNIEYLIVYIQRGYDDIKIGVMQRDEYIKRVNVKICEDGECRTLKKIENMK